MSQSHAITSITFDTLQYAKKLKKVGVSEEQAEVQAEAIKEQSEAIKKLIDDNLATKKDLKQLENELKRDILDVKKEINEMGYKLTMRLGSLMVVGIFVLAALINVSYG